MNSHGRASDRASRRSRSWQLLLAALALGFASHATPAAAQWSRIAAVPAANVFSLRAKGDTLLAGTGTVVFHSTDGVSWQPSTPPTAGTPGIFALWLRNGRIFAGTGAQGVFMSSDLGASWQAFNQGLVGGFANSQLDIADIQERGDSLYVATLGAGVYVRNVAVAGAWSHFGEDFEPNQASNVSDLELGGSRLMASAGANGMVFVRDPGAPEWTTSFLGNTGLVPGLSAHTAFWTGSHWVVGASTGVFLSPTGREPWTPATTNLNGATWATFVQSGTTILAAFDFLPGSLIVKSEDGGDNWTLLEAQPGVFVYQLALRGTQLYAARSDGLFIRGVPPLSVPGDGLQSGLRLALTSSQPVGDLARLTFLLAGEATATLELFDVQGRRAAPRIEAGHGAGPHEVVLDTHALASGVYVARISAGGASESLRLVRAH
jgi:hypothetical protein